VGKTNMINSGLYLIELELLDMIPRSMKMFYEYFPALAEKNRLVGYPFSGQWFDISSAEEHRRAEKDWRG
jgi:NDP-sugar pyrophosphorylase family protein